MQRWVVLVMLIPTLAGCISDSDGESDVDSTLPAGFDPCVHPWPCGDGTEWPLDLEGPFDLKEVRQEVVVSHDGTELHGWVALPDLPDGVTAPVILKSSPYVGSCRSALGDQNAFCAGSPDDEAYWTDPTGGTGIPEAPEGHLLGIPSIRFVEQGYAVAIFSVRGTGGSGGCFAFMNDAEQQDQAFLVDWLAGQAWSNGRVGMVGLSYPGTTPWEAAIHAPEGLKTIMTFGFQTDAYQMFTSPQGSFTHIAGESGGLEYPTSVGTAPPLGQSPTTFINRAPSSSEQPTCQELADFQQEFGRLSAGVDRNEALWTERNLYAHFDQITAAPFAIQGLHDNGWNAFQDDVIWDALGGPKRMILGQWGHTIPPDDLLTDYPGGDDAAAMYMDWLDYWLKGIGSPDRLGMVDYQVNRGEWRTTDIWPPTVPGEVLYLTSGTLAPAPATDASSFIGAPIDWANKGSRDCREDDREDNLVFWSEPVEESIVIAGNPWIHLALESNLPGGQMGAYLFRMDEGQDCHPWKQEDQLGGGIDLRFGAGNFIGKDFPVDTPTDVRIDLWNGALRLEPGDRLVLVLHGSGRDAGLARSGPAPTYTVHGDGSAGSSHLVLPIVEGTMGGEAPTIEYSPRPFTTE